MNRAKIVIELLAEDLDTDLYIVRWDGEHYVYTPINQAAVEDKLGAEVIFGYFLKDLSDLPDIAELAEDEEEA